MMRYLARSILLLIFIQMLNGCTPAPHLRHMDRNRALNAGLDMADFENSVPTLCEDEIVLRLTLDEMIEIAIQNNLDLAVKEQQYAIQRLITARSSLNMLPDFLIDTHASIRDNSPAAASKLYRPPGSPIVPPAVSSPRRVFTADYGAIWNLIDFGISYYKTRQEADRTAIAYFEYERVRQNIILQVVQSYWRIVSSKFAVDTAIPLVKELVERRVKLEEEIRDGAYLSEIDTTALLGRYFQREIQLKGFNDRTDSSDPTQGYEKEYENALVQLASLMRMPPKTRFEVDIDVDWSDEVDLPDIRELEATAILNRPELYSGDIQQFIAYDDVKQAVLQQLPSLSLSIQKFYDNNHFLVNNNWATAGINVIWHLLNIPKYYEEAKIGNYKAELARRLRMQLTMGILVQVNIAIQVFNQNREQYHLSKKYAEVSEHVAKLYTKQTDLGRKSVSDDVNARVDAALAKVNAVKVYAEMQSNLELLNNSIGLPRYFKTEKKEMCNE